jgi:hypothetical protein
MNGLITGLLSLCLVVAETVIAIGLLVALARVALGHRRAYAQLVGVGIALLVVVLWQEGQLGAVVHDAAGIVTTAARGNPGLPWATPAPGASR